MKSKALILALLLLCGLAAVFFVSRTSDSPSPKASIGLPAPAFELRDTNGTVWRLGDLRGKVVLINFWASWCTTCDQENPSIQNLINAYRGNDKFLALSILYKDDTQKALDYLKRKGFAFTVLLDDRDVATRYGVTGVPETFLIDGKGTLVHKVIGPARWDSTEVMETIARLVSGA